MYYSLARCWGGGGPLTMGGAPCETAKGPGPGATAPPIAPPLVVKYIGLAFKVKLHVWSHGNQNFPLRRNMNKDKVMGHKNDRFNSNNVCCFCLAVELCVTSSSSSSSASARRFPEVQCEHAPQVQHPQLQGAHLLRSLWLSALGSAATGPPV